MFGLFKRKPTIPPLSDDMLHAGAQTSSWCIDQVSEFVGGKVDLCPDYGEVHDQRIAAYSFGFLAGYLQVTRADVRWAHGDDGLIQIGLMALAAGCHTKVLGGPRALRVIPSVPLHGLGAEDLIMMDRYGGTDGMAHAESREKPKGGLLLHYLRHNVTVLRE